MQITKERFSTILKEEVEEFLEQKASRPFGRSRKVLKKGDWPENEAPGFDSFEDFYAEVDKYPEVKKLLGISRSGRRLPRGGKDFKWGPAHRRAYAALEGRSYGSVPITPEEEKQIKRARTGAVTPDTSNFFKYKDTASEEEKKAKPFQTVYDRYLKAKKSNKISPKAKAIIKQEYLTRDIEMARKGIRTITQQIESGNLSDLPNGVEFAKEEIAKLQRDVQKMNKERDRAIDKINTIALSGEDKPQEPQEDITFLSEEDLKIQGIKEHNLTLPQAWVYARMRKNGTDFGLTPDPRSLDDAQSVVSFIKNVKPEVLYYLIKNQVYNPNLFIPGIALEDNPKEPDDLIPSDAVKEALFKQFPRMKRKWSRDGGPVWLKSEFGTPDNRPSLNKQMLTILQTIFPETEQELYAMKKRNQEKKRTADL
tara:strand:+ start:152 stop:1423 length:1272 start_codon:yes stop_codon:yes gene_type:complete